MKVFVSLLVIAVCALASSGEGHDRDRDDHRPSPPSHHAPPHYYPPPIYRPVYPLYRPVYQVPVYQAPVIVTGSYYIPGYFDTRRDTVLVESARVEKQYVQPVFETRYSQEGKPYTVQIAVGYTKDIVIPARYEERETKVWIEGYWSSSPIRTGPVVVVAPAQVIVERPKVDVDIFFNKRGRGTSWGFGLGISD